MAFTNSPLVNHTRLCKDYSSGRYHKTHNPDGKIKKITIHHMAGNLSVEKCGELFATSPRDVSSNYGIGTDGRIGLYVEEKNRPWTSSSAANDYQAVTIEVANDTIGGNWHVSDKALKSIINLCADICKRNGIKKLNFTGDKSGNLTMHKWFQNTDCPGPWFSKQFNKLANDINKELNVKPSPTPAYDYSGTYRVNVDTLNVRVAPTVNSRIVAEYHRNDIVILENWHTIVNDYVWGRYIGATSGEYRYIAIGKYTGKIEDDDYLIKIS